MIDVFDAASGQKIGEISQDELQFLIDQLEEESTTDQDYYINQVTLDLFEKDGCPANLLSMLRAALGSNEDMDIRWDQQ